MKKLLVIIVFLASVFVLQAQTGTIKDKGTFIQLAYSSGDTTSIEKEQIIRMSTDGNRVILMTAHENGTYIESLVATDFSYPEAHSLRRFLETICFNTYDIVYTYDVSDNVDSIHYYFNSTLNYSEAFGYTGGNLTSKTIVTY